MQELRFVAVSEDGSYAVLAVPGRSGRYILPIDERLRAVALGQTSRLAQYEIEVESPLRPKEIQARIRAGETAEEIADAAGIPVERVRWFEGPVLAERAYIADQAQSGSVRRAGESAGPGPRLGAIVTERLTAAGTDPADGQWDSRKRGDGNWQVSLTFPSGGRLHVAEWVFDPRRRHVMPDDDNAARLSLPESELPAEPAPMPGEATVTPIAPRLGAAAGMGGGVSAPGVSRFRPERSIIPDRSLGTDRSLVERPAAMPERVTAGPSDHAAAPSSPAPSSPAAPRPGQQDRPSHAGRPANPGYAEFPESVPYRAPEPPPSPEPPDRREPGGHDDPVTEPPAYREPAPQPRSYRDPVGFRGPAAEPPAYGGQGTESPGHHAPMDEVPAFDQPERVPAAPPRPVVFEDPDLAPEPAIPAPPARVDAPPGPQAAAAPAEVSLPAPAAASTDVAVRQAPEPPAAAQPEISEPEPAAVRAAAQAAATGGQVRPGAETPAAGLAAPEPNAEASAPAEPGSAEAQAARRPGKKNAKARRSSVPSWDEIMLGSSRQRD